MPELRALEEKFAGQPFTVVGVHSGKFYTEQEAANTRQAVMRYNIEHPVVVDAGFRIWQSYGVRAWPTLVVIDPGGYVVGATSGEGNQDMLERVISQLLEAHAEQGTLDRAALPIQLERLSQPETPLSFPGKVLADAQADLLAVAVADTNHNRIVLAHLDGRLIDVAGSGAAGMADGDYATASFRQPQGMALIGRSLYIAMAGPHQIWVFEPGSGQCRVVAGTGMEAKIDGPAEQAALAQPSGLACDGRTLFIADSEVSCIRALSLGPRPSLWTVAGGDLFEFGDVDGVGDQARLQHPLGACLAEGMLYVADTYNHRVKRVGPSSRLVASYLGDGKPGLVDGPGASVRFYEPAGIAAAGGCLYIADTNSHAIRVADLATATVRTLSINGLDAP